MNPAMANQPAVSLPDDLEAYRTLCAEVLDLMTMENRALLDQHDYEPGKFNERRKNLLPQLESALIKLRKHRQSGRQGVHSEGVKDMMQTIQGLLMKGLFIDRENQQSLLRRGLVPPRHLPPVGAQQPHYVAGLYRQHARGGGGGSL
jgi:hypothetical protein